MCLCVFNIAHLQHSRFSFYLSFSTEGYFQELGVATLCVSDEEKKLPSQYVWARPMSMCDLDVIQIFSSGCWLRVHYNAVCFWGVKHTTRSWQVWRWNESSTPRRICVPCDVRQVVRNLWCQEAEPRYGRWHWAGELKHLADTWVLFSDWAQETSAGTFIPTTTNK